ncbi:MAG: branched-chain amino acid ABC transporter permease [Alphaproteobacteria bacterium]|nr:branched-chain amino acid ABC transporter permease [Alphaproteobacteria bacterium]
MTALDTTAPKPRVPFLSGDLAPLALLGAVVFLPLALIAPSTWLVLTVAGLAMGMMIFLMASGLTLVFGLMGIINFGHGAFISLGAFVGATVVLKLSGFTATDSIATNLVAIVPSILLAMLAAGLVGWAFERWIIRPVYDNHLKQILVTVGGLIVAEQLIVVLWGPDQIALPRPTGFKGSWGWGEVAFEKYRLLACVVGIAVFWGLHAVLNKTKLGLLIRAGVENGRMVEALGYPIRRLFVLVFCAGSALAGLGGVMWGLYEELLTAAIGGKVMVLVFIVIIIGGLGSVGGCFLGAILVGLIANYTGFLAPKLALVSNILLMVAVLMWRPQGLYAVIKH